MNSTIKQSKNYLKYFHHDYFQKKMAREYLSWVGILSRYEVGNNLLSQFGILEILMQKYIEEEGRHDHLVVQVLLSLDYSREEGSRVFF